jgi:ATP-binding cassette subfamily C (CFTR/MRP) protein 1
MRAFCQDPLWDLNVTWNTDEPDFTHCFHATVLVYVPCALLWLGLPLKWLSWRSSTSRNVPWTIINLARLVVNALLIVICCLQLIMELVYLDSGRPSANIVAPAVLVMTFAVAILLGICDQKLGITSSGIQFGLWSLLALTSTFTFTSFVRFPDDHPSGERALFYLYYGLIMAQLLLTSWADPPPRYKEFKGTMIVH